MPRRTNRQVSKAEWRALAEQAQKCSRALAGLADLSQRLLPGEIADKAARLAFGHLQNLRAAMWYEMRAQGGHRNWALFFGKGKEEGKDDPTA